MAWTAASIFPTTFLRDQIAARQAPPPGTVLTPEQKLRLSGGVVRHALTAPASTGSGGATTRRDTQAVASTGSGLVAPAPTPTPAPTNQGNMPDFLTSGQNQTTPLQAQDLLSMLTDLISGQRQDPDLVKAQTVLAQQQAMATARENQYAREREQRLATQQELQNNLRNASQFSGLTGDILTKRYSDQLKAFQKENQPPSWFDLNPPRRSGWTGPAMPGGWAI